MLPNEQPVFLRDVFLRLMPKYIIFFKQGLITVPVCLGLDVGEEVFGSHMGVCCIHIYQGLYTTIH